MATVSEIQQAKQWIYDVLHGDAQIAAAVGVEIYADYNPKKVADRGPRYIIFNYLGGVDVDALGTARLLSEPLFQVRLVTNHHDEPGGNRPNTTDRLVEKRIDDVLQAAVYQQSGDYYFSARREQPVDRAELDTATGKRYHNLGGLYRLWIGATV